MARRAALLSLAFALACANPEEEEPVRRDAGPDRDAGRVRDGGPRDGGARDGGSRDGGSRDAGSRDGGELVVPVSLAYTAADEVGLRALFVTASSTTSYEVTPTLAGGPTIDSKGGPTGSGVFGFEWIEYGDGLIYEAQQDTYDRREIYFAFHPNARSERVTYKQSRSDADGPTSGFGLFPTGRWHYFYQIDQSRTNFYIRHSGTSTASRRLNRGTVLGLSISSADYVAYQDIVVGGPSDDRDLWVASPSAEPFRVNAGANVGFGGSMAWAPGGREIAYNADERFSRVFELYRYDVTFGGAGARELMFSPMQANADVTVGQGSVQYSPANTHLAYLADADTDELVELYEIDLTESPPRTQHKISGVFTAGADGVDRFDYSPDGTYVAYVADVDTLGLGELYVARSGMQEAVRMHPALAAGERVIGERWLEDDRIAFIVLGNGARRAFVADLATFPPGPATELSNPPFQFAAANRSPSGRYVVYVDDASPRNLWMTDLTATPLTQTMVIANATTWCWSFDDQLAVITQPDGGDRTRLELIRDVAAPAPVWIRTPDDLNVLNCKFAPEGE
ncbi:MAG: hypothetical protein RMA76_27690 [Deltaproteobacteria bacterium]|jgi:hypothetical protein